MVKSNQIFKIQFIFLITFFCVFASKAQDKYFIYFKDKNFSPYSIANPHQFLSSRSVDRRIKQNIPFDYKDLPVSPAYVDSLKDIGVNVLYTSRWMNAALITCSPEQLEEVKQIPIVADARATARIKQSTSRTQAQISRIQKEENNNPADFGHAKNQLEMIGVDIMHKNGFKGEGMLIAVLDNGYLNANNISCFDTIFNSGRVIGTWDFVQHSSDVFDEGEHGTLVWSAMAAYKPGTLIGPAYNASYLLLVSEDNDSETITEEINWLLAAEYADSAGADIISSSLGYNTFDNPAFDYTYSDMNGVTTICSRAAEFAASVGILVITSAGNEGNKSWKYITAPGDAENVLTVGAVNEKGYIASFSSRGPTSDMRIKPDVCARGTSTACISPGGNLTFRSGTSLSCPLIAGFAAGLWQANPDMTNLEMLDLIRTCAHRSNNPDNNYGYGIPHYQSAQFRLNKSFDPKERFFIFPNPMDDQMKLFINDYQEIGEEVSIKLFDLSGRLIAEEVLSNATIVNNLSIEPDYLLPGYYIYRIQGRNSLQGGKLLKQ
ncbi:MAG: S8 family serine peptidase [Cytophagaceae bacterium]